MRPLREGCFTPEWIVKGNNTCPVCRTVSLNICRRRRAISVARVSGLAT
jgi:hypothetical protein